MKNKKVWIGIIIVLLLVVFIVAAVAKKPVAEDTIGGFKNGPRVKVEVVKKDDIQTRISSSGKLEAKDTETIYAENNNKIITIHRKIGDTIKKGDVLLTLETDSKEKSQRQLESLEFQLKAEQEALNLLLVGGSKQDILNAQSTLLQYQKAEQDAKDMLSTQKTNLQNIERDLKNQKLDYEVQQKLFNEGLIAQKEFDDAKNALTELQQKLESTQTAIVSAQKTIESQSIQKQTAEYELNVLLNKVEDPKKRQTISAKQSDIKNLEARILDTKSELNKSSAQILASMDGVIIEAPTQEGMLITPGMTLFKIIDPSKLIVSCDISPYYAADLKVGLEAKLKYIGSKTIEVDGKVTRVSPVAIVKQSVADKTGATANIPIEIEVSDPGTVIKPGFSVDVKVITETRKGVCVIPLLATIEDDDESTYVYVVKEDGTLEKRVVNQGLSNGLNIEADNLDEGELIVANPTEFIKEGMKVSYEKTGDMQ